MPMLGIMASQISGHLSVPGTTWTASTLPSSAAWYPAAFGNGTWCVGIDSATGAATSTNNGTTWTARTGNINFNGVAMAYGAGVFAAMAPSGLSAQTSPDGATWTTRTVPTNQNYNSLVYGGGLFVAVPYGGNTAITSSDAITWTNRTLPTQTTARRTAIAYGAGTYAITSRDASHFDYSTNGTTWTAATNPGSANWYYIGYNGTKWLATVDNSTTYATSNDAITWTSATAAVTFQGAISALGSTFVVGGAAATANIYTSTNGTTFTTRTLPSSGTWLNNITNGSTAFMAFRYSSSAAAYSNS